MSLPTGLYQSTTPPEPEAEAPANPIAAGQGGEAQGEDEPAAAKPAAKSKKKKAAAAGADKDGWKLYLTEDVRFRLRMLAFKRGQKLSTVANEVLDKALPRWSLERTD